MDLHLRLERRALSLPSGVFSYSRLNKETLRHMCAELFVFPAGT